MPFYVEFPPGPLSIGADLDIRPIEVDGGAGPAFVLSPTDSCRDRLAAFYHWRDRQSLQVAVSIARVQPVDLAAIREWSRAEVSVITSNYKGSLSKFDAARLIATRVAAAM